MKITKIFSPIWNFAKTAFAMVGASLFIILIMGMLVVCTHPWNKPDQHDYQWFLSQVCPKAQQDGMHPVKPKYPSVFFEQCVAEIKNTQGHSNATR